MNTEHLYDEHQCRRCHRMKLRSSNFCPHCGHTHEETWFDKVRDFFADFNGSETVKPATKTGYYSIILTALVSLYFFYEAIAKGSLMSLVPAIITLVFAVRTWLAMRGKTEEYLTPSGGDAQTREDDRADNLLATKYSCEHCGASIGELAPEAHCKECGTVFGG